MNHRDQLPLAALDKASLRRGSPPGPATTPRPPPSGPGAPGTPSSARGRVPDPQPARRPPCESRFSGEKERSQPGPARRGRRGCCVWSRPKVSYCPLLRRTGCGAACGCTTVLAVLVLRLLLRAGPLAGPTAPAPWPPSLGSEWAFELKAVGHVAILTPLGFLSRRVAGDGMLTGGPHCCPSRGLRLKEPGRRRINGQPR